MAKAISQPSKNERKGDGPFLRFLVGLVRLLENSGKVISAACLTFMFAALLMNVILRYALGSGIAWAYEIHALLLPWLVAGGIVIASVRGRHIAINLLPDMLDVRQHRWLFMIIEIFIIAICVSVLWSSMPILRASQFQTLSTLGVKQIWGYSSLVYAFSAIILVSASKLIVLFIGAQADRPEPAATSLS